MVDPECIREFLLTRYSDEVEELLYVMEEFFNREQMLEFAEYLGFVTPEKVCDEDV